MAEFALKTSSTKATVAVGRYPSVWRTYWSFSRPRMDSGPNSSSGTEKRVRRRSKNEAPPHTAERRRPSSDLAVPGDEEEGVLSAKRREEQESNLGLALDEAGLERGGGGADLLGEVRGGAGRGGRRRRRPNRRSGWAPAKSPPWP